MSLLLTLAVVMVSGCSSSSSVPSQPPVLNAAELTALDAQRVTTTLAATPLAQIPFVAQLNATLPKPAAVGRVSSGDVDAALHFAAELVAATHQDPAVICGSDATRRAALKKFSDGAAKTWIDDPKNADSFDVIVPGIADLVSEASCAGSRLVGPGVVLGPQSWKVRPGDRGNELSIDYVGLSTLLFADTAGHATPLSTRYRATYVLTNASGARWALTSLASESPATHTSILSIVDQVLVPDAYLPAVATGTLRGDSKALAAVQAAMAQWAGSAAAVVITRTVGKTDGGEATSAAGPKPAPSLNASTGAMSRTLPDGTEEYTQTEVVAPRRGDSWAAGTGPVTDFTIRRGTESYSRADLSEALTPFPFTHGNPKAHWLHYVVGGLGGGLLAPGSSWDWYDVLTTAEAAAPTPCPAAFSASGSRPVAATDTSAEVCYAVSVRTGPGVRLTSVGPTLALLASSGRRVLTFTVGLDRSGRLTQVTDSAERVLFGKRVSHVIVQSWFPKPTGVAPAAPQIPAAADTAEGDDFY